MNKRQIKIAIKQNKCLTLAATQIKLEPGEKLLPEDLVSLLNRLQTDSHSFLTPSLGHVQCVVEMTTVGLNLGWVMIPSEQGNLLATPDSTTPDSTTPDSTTLDSGAMQELQEKLTFIAREVVASIDMGNELAHEISRDGMTSNEIINRLQSAPNKLVTRKVTARAAGPQISFVFPDGEHQLGGNLLIPKEYTSDESISINNCQVVRWISEKEIKLRANSLPTDTRFSTFFKKNEFCVRVQRGGVDSSILNCASFSETSFNIDVSRGLLLKNEKHVLQLAKIHNPLAILEAGQSRLNELFKNQES